MANVSQLKTQLLSSGLNSKDQNLYQVINQLIDVIAGLSSTVTLITSGTTTPGTLGQTFLTKDDETGTLPDSLQVLPGSGIAFNDIGSRRIINATIPLDFGGGGGEDGDSGPPGPTGPAGTSGSDGPQGQSGPLQNFPAIDGENGQDGFPLPGPQGQIGPSGNNGVPVILILDGEDGPECIPIPGPAGSTGGNASPYYISGSGNPQGNVTASVGTIYVDTVTGYPYVKQGGGSTAFGWYLNIPLNGAGFGPNAFLFNHSGFSAATSFRTIAYGPLALAVADGAEYFTTSGVTTIALNNTNGKFYKTITSAATSGTNTYVSGSGATLLRDWLDDNLDMWFDFQTGPGITNIRIWAGMSSAVLSNSDTFATASNGALLFRYSTSASDSGWIGQSSKNGTSNHTETSSIASIATSTIYRLRMRFVRQGTPTVYFSVNDSTELSSTTNIPPTGSTYFPIFGFTTLANTAQTVGFRSIAGWQGS